MYCIGPINLHGDMKRYVGNRDLAGNMHQQTSGMWKGNLNYKVEC